MPKPSDLHDLNFASDVQISSDGHLVAFVVSKASGDRKTYKSAIHLSRDGAADSQFTSGKGKDANPRFSHDGTLLAFTRSTWDSKAQLMLMPLAGGEALALTTLKSGVSGPRWSSDNQKIAFLSRGDWEDSSRADGLPRIITSLQYKKNELSGAGIMPSEPLQLWVYDLKTAKLSAATKHPAVHPTPTRSRTRPATGRSSSPQPSISRPAQRGRHRHFWCGWAKRRRSSSRSGAVRWRVSRFHPMAREQR